MQSISTRSVGDDLVKALGLSGVSKRQVSCLRGELDERVSTFLSRQIQRDWPYLWIDATDVKTREARRVVSRAESEHRRQARGAQSEGRRVGNRAVLDRVPSQPEPASLRDVTLAISDSREGIEAAAAWMLKATWQRC